MIHLLFVDDTGADLTSETWLAEQSEWRVEFARSTEDALVLVGQKTPDVVIADMSKPKAGLKVIAAMQAAFPRVPVIFMTSHSSEELAVQALKLGAASFIPKKSLQRTLPEAVNSVLIASGNIREEARLFEYLQRSLLTFELENDCALISPLISILQDRLKQMDFGDQTDRVRLGIALEEALVNAMHHGNLEVPSELREQDYRLHADLVRQRQQESPYRERKVQVQFELTPQCVSFSVRDQGPGFDPRKLPDPTAAANLERSTGRGLLLMRTFMDEVKYNRQGNQVEMTKRAASEENDSAPEVFVARPERGVLLVIPLRNFTSMSELGVREEWTAVLEKFDSSSVQHVLVDFQQVPYFGSTLLGALQKLWRKAKQRDGQLVLCNVSTEGCEVLRLTSFDTIWPVFSHREAALHKLTM